MIKLSKFAKDLGVTKVTLWNWKKAGKLTFHKVGGLNVVDVDTYNKFLGIKEKKEDLVQDFVSVITSFCARIYGQ